ncbi:MAG: T9SS type A sorting domain-containing protein [Bacteroidetes bacterium]|jgi:hypothetical protein|nr:T9SS type A sorting domain-containing protein [Bacteroidota bacterium]
MVKEKILPFLILTPVMLLVFYQQTYAQFSGSGSGTASDPYIITNVTQLQEIENDRSAYYELGNDINATETANWNGGAGFDPIGDNRYSYFSGSLQGNGYNIINLTINRPSESLIGLFGNDRSSNIENLQLINIDYAGRGAVGGLIGQKQYGTIKNVFVSGKITVNSNDVGGIVGSLYSSDIQNSHAAVDISSCRNRTGGLVGNKSRGEILDSSASGSLDCTGDYSRDFIGGLVGKNGDGDIINSYASGNITGKSYVGGLVGSNTGVIVKSYSTGNVVGGSRVGGLVGSNGSLIEACFSIGFVDGGSQVGGLLGNNSGPVYSSYSSGRVSGLYSNIGGIVGYNTGTVNNSYWSTETSEQGSSGGGSGLTTAQMTQQANFTGFDFTNTWQIYEGYSFPFLKDVGDHITSVVKITGTENWRTMSSPLTDASYNKLLKELWTQGFTGADYDGGKPNIFTRSESTQSWDPVSNASNVPGTGSGFLVYVYKDDQYGESGSFPKTLVKTGKQHFGTVSLPVSLTNSGSGNSYVEADDGWNFVGNPYASPIDWDGTGWTKNGLSSSIYIWSEQDDAYRTWNGSTGSLGSGVIAPWQGFWVKADNSGSPSLELNENARSTGGQFLKEQRHPILEFTLEGEEKKSNAFVMVHPEASTGLDQLDAWKLESFSSDYLSFHSLLPNGDALEINSIPDSKERTITVEFDLDGSDIKGNYRLLWNTENLPVDAEFILTDLVADEEVDLKEKQSYLFEITGVEKNRKAKEDSTVWVYQKIKPEIRKSNNYRDDESARFILSISYGSSDHKEELPTSVDLKQNYPNPFNPTTVISYQLPVKSEVQLKVFDLTGRQVATLVDGQVQAGTHNVRFDGSSLSSGVYIYRLQTGDQRLTKKFTLIK